MYAVGGSCVSWGVRLCCCGLFVVGLSVWVFVVVVFVYLYVCCASLCNNEHYDNVSDP